MGTDSIAQRDSTRMKSPPDLGFPGRVSDGDRCEEGMKDRRKVGVE